MGGSIINVINILHVVNGIAFDQFNQSVQFFFCIVVCFL